jgi:hypothetical protein
LGVDEVDLGLMKLIKVDGVDKLTINVIPKDNLLIIKHLNLEKDRALVTLSMLLDIFVVRNSVPALAPVVSARNGVPGYI